MKTVFTVLLVILSLFTISTISAWIEIFLAERENNLHGLIMPFILFFAGIALFSVLYLSGYGALISIAFALLMNIPLLITLAFYIYKRRLIYRRKADEFRKINSSDYKPSKKLSLKTRNRIASFSDPKSSIQTDKQREILQRLESQEAIEGISLIYRQKRENIIKLWDNFKKYCDNMDDNERGIPYKLSERQAQMYINMLFSYTPKSAYCGDTLLWSKETLKSLISSYVNIDIASSSIDEFMKENSLVIPEDALIEKKINDPDFKKWVKNDFNKIRLTANETYSEIAFVYSSHPQKDNKSKKMTMLSALKKGGDLSFGIYKGDAGYKDFIDKLAQDNQDKIIIITENMALYDKLNEICAQKNIPCFSYS